MKDNKFKMSEIGEIPADWEVKSVSSYYDVGSSKRVFQSQWRTEGVPFYRARDIVGFNKGERDPIQRCLRFLSEREGSSFADTIFRLHRRRLNA